MAALPCNHLKSSRQVELMSKITSYTFIHECHPHIKLLQRREAMFLALIPEILPRFVVSCLLAVERQFDIVVK